MGVNNGGVGRVTVSFPNRSPIKGFKSLSARGHVAEASEPYKSVGILTIMELPYHFHTASCVSTNSRSNNSIRTSRIPGCIVYCLSSTMGQQVCDAGADCVLSYC